MDYKSLKNVVQYHDKLYYENAAPVIPDKEYDQLYDRLVQMEKLQGWKDPDSPTIRVGYGGEIKHPHKLYSLKKVYTKDEVDTRFTIELPKIDGVNLSLMYFKQQLTTMLTRGDGEKGQNVIHLSKVIKGIPAEIPEESECVFVGEVVTDSENVSNFRNYVAGALGLKSVTDAKNRNLRFIVHDVLNLPQAFLSRMEYARRLGFYTVDLGDYSKYPQDGIVYRTNSYELEQELGYTAKHPKFAVALKQKESFSAITSLKEIRWELGRSGVLTPVGILEPVILDDAQVARVTLHNLEFVLNNNLGAGDLIQIERRITPQFVKVVEHSNYARFTVDDARRQHNGNVYQKGPKLYAEDDTSFRLVEHFCKTLGIKGMGPRSIQILEIYHPSELYDEDVQWDLLGANGIKIIQELLRPKDYVTVLSAVGIPGVGKGTAKKIIAEIPKFEDLHKIATVKIPQVGPKTIEAVLDWLAVNEEWVSSLPYTLEATETPKIDGQSIIKKIAITGKLDMTKEELGAILSKFNFQRIDNVTKDCYALITGGEESSKTEKAKKYGIPIYNYWEHKVAILKGVI